MMNDQSVRLDRMRFTKNTTSSRLVLLAIVLDALYFVSLYRINLDYYYNMMMGASILYNLVFMLATFLASEGVKNYKRNYSFLLLALGVGQIIRFFVIPMHAHQETTVVNGAETLVMRDGQFIRVAIYLAVSAVCLFAAGLINLYKCRELSEHQKSLAAQTA